MIHLHTHAGLLCEGPQSIKRTDAFHSTLSENRSCDLIPALYVVRIRCCRDVQRTYIPTSRPTLSVRIILALN